MGSLTDHYFEVCLAYLDGRKIAPRRFRTAQEAMIEAERYKNVVGEISYFEDETSDPVTTIIYNADGSIDAGASFPDEDPDYVDQPWTEAEIEANIAASAISADEPPRHRDEVSEDNSTENIWGVSKFRDDDAGYLDWLAAHPNGYVINAVRNYSDFALREVTSAWMARVHCASCRTINSQHSRGETTGRYVKVCAEELSELEDWATSAVGELVAGCTVCYPNAGSPTTDAGKASTATVRKEPFAVIGPNFCKMLLVQAWADDYIRFERLPAWQEALRGEIRRRCRRLSPFSKDVFHATFYGPKPPHSDVENLAIYNIDSFSKSGSCGIRFELGGAVPPAPDGREYRFGYRYEIVPRSGFFANWARGRTLASFDWTDLGAFAGEKKLAQVWLAIARTHLDLSRPAEAGKPFAVRIEVRPPHGQQPVWGRLLKQVIDGVICAMQAQSETPVPSEVTQRIAEDLGVQAEEVERLLSDRSRAVLGEVPRLVSPYRSGVKWNPSDHLLVAGELRAAEPEPGNDRWAIKGQVFRVS